MSILTLSKNHSGRMKKIASDAAAYAAFTVSVSKYPTDIQQLVGNVTAPVLYTAIGIANEVGELSEVFDNYMTLECDAAGRLKAYEHAWKELGDVQWYIARLCAELPGLPSFESMVAHAMEAVIAGSGDTPSGFDVCERLCICSGRVLGVVKKMMRDGGEWTPEKRAEKLAEMHKYLQLAVDVSVRFAELTGPLVNCPGGYSAVLEHNRAKLEDRKERGTLKGDGDNR